MAYVNITRNNDIFHSALAISLKIPSSLIRYVSHNSYKAKATLKGYGV